MKWPGSWSEVHITVKELLPIIMGVALWGRSWRGRTIRCRCDKMAVVAILKSGSSKDERAMHLMRSFSFWHLIMSYYWGSIFQELRMGRQMLYQETTGLLS